MRELNIEFQEQYKKLDKLCKDMYSTGEGVGAYLQAMESTPYSARYAAFNWDDIYKQLKHARWMRNQLAHELPIDSEFCGQKDIDWLTQFYNDLINCNDPLALVAKAKGNETIQSQENKSTNIRIQTLVREKKSPARKRPVNLNLYLFIANVALAAISIFAIIFLWQHLPPIIPMHWNGQFVIDRYGSKNELFILVILPVILLSSDVITYFLLRAQKWRKVEASVAHGLCAIFQVAFIIYVIILYADYLI